MATSLADQKCVPCKGGTPPLTDAEIAPLRAELGPGWEVEAGTKLIKSFSFKNFVAAVDFVNAIARVAEEEGHHPDLYVRWGQVRVFLWTHVIDGLTPSDFVMAAKIDRIYDQLVKAAPVRGREA